MPELYIEADKESFDAVKSLLSGIQNGVKRAGVAAANKTAATGKSRISSILASQLDSTKRGISRNVYVSKANTTNLPAAIIKVKSRGVNLIAFRARQTLSGVSSKIKAVPHAFIEIGLGKNRLVFLRQGYKKVMKKGRYAGKRREVIAGVLGMSAQELYRHIPGAAQSVASELKAVMSKNLQNQIKRLLDSRGKATE